MAKSLATILTVQKALIFRITHRSNLPWILANGLHCRGGDIADPNFITIGNTELIERRRTREVPISPGGTLDEYVPFYFTPLSPMLMNITTGYGGIRQRKNDEIVILVSSLDRLDAHGVRYVFTDRHAYLQTAMFHSNRIQLGSVVDFPLLQRRDFRSDDEDPGKKERYQAEALAHDRVPTAALLGIGCYTPAITDEIAAMCSLAGANLDIVYRPEWYF